jgi:hypothetical protein
MDLSITYLHQNTLKRSDPSTLFPVYEKMLEIHVHNPMILKAINFIKNGLALGGNNKMCIQLINASISEPLTFCSEDIKY